MLGEKYWSNLGRASVSGLPTLVFAIIVLPVAWLASRLLSQILQQFLKTSVKSDLLRRVTARSIGFLVFLLAVDLVLQVTGFMAQLALTI